MGKGKTQVSFQAIFYLEAVYPLIIELDTAINRATFLIGRVEGFAADNSMGLGR